MKRLWHFILGLWIIVAVGTLLFLQIDYEQFTEYQEQLLAYNWFLPTLYAVTGALLLIGFIYLFSAFKRSYKSKHLVTSYPDGELFVNKKSIEKTVLHTLQKYNNVRQPSIDVNLYTKKQSSYVDISADVFVTQTESIQSYLQGIREDIKTTVEQFAELPVREINLNVLDQKTLKKRVL